MVDWETVNSAWNRSAQVMHCSVSVGLPILGIGNGLDLVPPRRS